VPSSPLVDPQSGEVNPEWRRFFILLFDRTGAALGPPLDLATESALRQAADASQAQDLADETTARVRADASQSAQLAAETTARTNADTNLQNALNTETTARQAGDTATHWASLDLSGLPTTNPGGGQPWLSSGNIHVGP